MKGKLWKNIAAYNVSKNAAIPQVFFNYILRTVPNVFHPFQSSSASSPFQQVILYHSNSCVIQLTRDADFPSNGSQMMSYYHVKKYPIGNKYWNLNLE